MKTHWKHLQIAILTLGLGFSGGVSAQEPPPERPSRRGAGSERQLEHLRQRDPQAYGELMRLRNEDPEAFRRALRERLVGRRGPDDREHRENGGPPRPGGREFVQHVLERLAARDPEKAEALRKLYVEDPAAFRDEIRKMLGRQPPPHGRPERGDDVPGRIDEDARRELDALRESYRTAADDTARDHARDAARERLGKLFDADLDRQAARLAAMEKQFALMKERLEARRSQRDELVDQQTNDFLQRTPPSNQ